MRRRNGRRQTGDTFITFSLISLPRYVFVLERRPAKRRRSAQSLIEQKQKELRVLCVYARALDSFLLARVHTHTVTAFR